MFDQEDQSERWPSFDSGHSLLSVDSNENEAEEVIIVVRKSHVQFQFFYSEQYVQNTDIET